MTMGCFFFHVSGNGRNDKRGKNQPYQRTASLFNHGLKKKKILFFIATQVKKYQSNLNSS